MGHVTNLIVFSWLVEGSALKRQVYCLTDALSLRVLGALTQSQDPRHQGVIADQPRGRRDQEPKASHAYTGLPAFDLDQFQAYRRKIFMAK